jgi:hypothetical protein
MISKYKPTEVLYGSVGMVDLAMEEGSEETVLIRCAIQNLCRHVYELEKRMEPPKRWR